MGLKFLEKLDKKCPDFVSFDQVIHETEQPDGFMIQFSVYGENFLAVLERSKKFLAALNPEGPKEHNQRSSMRFLAERTATTTTPADHSFPSSDSKELSGGKTTAGMSNNKR
jgi:hypothetical protein